MQSKLPAAASVALMALFAACSESTNPAIPAVSAPNHGPRFSAAGGTGVSKERLKHYSRVRIDRERKTMRLESVRTASVNSGCSPTELICDDGSTATCAPLDPDCGPWLGVLPISGVDSIYVDNGTAGYDATADEYGPYFCPAYVDDPHFVWRGHHFEIDGRAQKIADLAMISGLPKGRYLLPPGPWISDDGQARIWSGTIDGTCFVRDHHVLGFRVTEGFMTWYKFTGDGDDNSASGGGGAGGIWVSYGGSGGGRYIDADAARALTAYLDDGTCTAGWWVFVDGVRVC